MSGFAADRSTAPRTRRRAIDIPDQSQSSLTEHADGTQLFAAVDPSTQVESATAVVEASALGASPATTPRTALSRELSGVAPAALPDVNVGANPVSAAATSMPTSAGFVGLQALKRPNIVKVPTFKGDQGDSVKVVPFLRRLDAFLTFHGIVDNFEVQRLVLYQAFPEDSNAAQWFEGKEATMHSMTDFVTAFRARFALNTADRGRILSQYEQHKQASNVAVSDYYHSLRQIVDNLRMVNVTFIPEQILTKFIMGLRPELRAIVLTQQAVQQDIDIEKALTIAMTHELNIKTHALTIDESPELRAAHVDSTSRLRCGYCKKQGHSFNDCPKVKARKAEGKWKYVDGEASDSDGHQ